MLQEGLAAAVGLGGSAPVVLPDPDDLREQEGLPMLPGWQARRTARLCGDLFPDRQRLEERLLEAAAAATVLRNAAEVEQNSALLLDPPVMRCWTWCLNAARELVLQQAGPAPATGDGAEEAAGNGSPAPADGTGSGSPTGAAASPAREATLASSCGGDSFASVVVGGGPAADICTSLLQLATVLSGHMLLPAFFECGMMLMRSLLILLRPTWQQCCAGGGGTVLPPPLVALATQAVAAVATAYQPNIDILLSMTGAPGSGRPGSTLMQVVADMLVCPFDVFRWAGEGAVRGSRRWCGARTAAHGGACWHASACCTTAHPLLSLPCTPHSPCRQHAQQHVDEESPGWRHLLPTDAQLLREARRTLKAAASGHGAGGGNRGPTELGYTAAELCMLDMLAVLSQLRYLSSMLHLLWRVLTAAEPGGANARAAAAGCPRLLSTLCDIAVHQCVGRRRCCRAYGPGRPWAPSPTPPCLTLHPPCPPRRCRWPQHPVRWHAEGHTLRNPDAYPAYLRFLSHDMMPAMRERQELLQPLRADAAALLALLAADPETRASVAWCEGPLVTAVMSGTVPPTEPGVSALLARFAAQGGGGGGGGTAAPAKAAMPAPAAEPMQTG